jgi:hypothetical protein
MTIYCCRRIFISEMLVYNASEPSPTIPWPAACTMIVERVVKHAKRYHMRLFIWVLLGLVAGFLASHIVNQI